MNVSHTTMLRGLTLQSGLILASSRDVACDEFGQHLVLTVSEVAT